MLTVSKRTNNINFVNRHYSLRKLEGDYKDFAISCRHRDMLRCSDSRHFRSCYSPDGSYSYIPYALCSNPNFAILGKKDKSGSYLWRAFIEIFPYDSLKVYKIYGNPPSMDIRNIIYQRLLPKVFTTFYEMDAV